eukprot:4439648-Pleurochrysis_carterae.AAC.1
MSVNNCDARQRQAGSACERVVGSKGASYEVSEHVSEDKLCGRKTCASDARVGVLSMCEW